MRGRLHFSPCSEAEAGERSDGQRRGCNVTYVRIDTTTTRADNKTLSVAKSTLERMMKYLLSDSYGGILRGPSDSTLGGIVRQVPPLIAAFYFPRGAYATLAYTLGADPLVLEEGAVSCAPFRPRY